MRTILIFISAIALVAVTVGCLTTAPRPATTESPLIGQTLYTQHVMWAYEDEIDTTNYSIERKIPLNTPIVIERTWRYHIYFHTIDNPDFTYDLINKEEYTGLDNDGLIQRTFSPDQVSIDALSPEDQAFIRGFYGYYFPGITKEAMLIGRGYPPIHRTPTLESNVWIYWQNKWTYKTVEFIDGKTAYVNGQPIPPR